MFLMKQHYLFINDKQKQVAEKVWMSSLYFVSLEININRVKIRGSCSLYALVLFSLGLE